MCKNCDSFRCFPPYGYSPSGAHMPLEHLIGYFPLAVSIWPTYAPYNSSCWTPNYIGMHRRTALSSFSTRTSHKELSKAQGKKGGKLNTHPGTHLKKLQLLHEMSNLFFEYFPYGCSTSGGFRAVSEGEGSFIIESRTDVKCLVLQYYQIWQHGSMHNV